MKLLFKSLSIAYLALICAMAMSPFWPKQFYWLAGLFQMAPLWPLYLPLVFFCLVAVVMKSRFIFIFCIVSFIIIMFPIMGFNIPLNSLMMHAGKPENSIKIMSCNIGGGADIKLLAAYISRIKPDIVALQEVSSANQDALTRIFNSSKWELSFNGGLGLASRFKIKSVQAKNRNMFGGWGSVMVRYEINAPMGRLNIFNIHLESPRKGIEAVIEAGLRGLSAMNKAALLQDRESRALSQWIVEYRDAIITGDFNMTKSNPIYKRCWSSWTDSFSSAGFGFGYTKHTRWHGVRIDHILVGKRWIVRSAQAGPSIGADHRPVVSQIEYSY